MITYVVWFFVGFFWFVKPKSKIYVTQGRNACNVNDTGKQQSET